MHVVHVVRDLDSASGGPSRSVPALANSQLLVRADDAVSVVFQLRGNPLAVQESDSQFRCIAVDASELRRRRSLDRRLTVLDAERQIDFIHLHGLWSPFLYAASRFASNRGIPYAVAPRGMLSPWALRNKRLKKAIAWRMYQHGALARASLLHVTSDQERHDVEASGIEVPCVLIPNGCDVPASEERVSNDPQVVDGGSTRWCVAVGRIHPVKGLRDLIRAWHRLRPLEWKLAIAGPDEDGHRGELLRLVDELQLQDRVVLVGELDQTQTHCLLRQAELLVQASHSENFAMAVAESLAVGTPVIATQGTPWQEVAVQGCGWWVPVGVEGLESALAEATKMPPSQLAEMGERGVRLIESSYSWREMARRSWAAYEWVLGGRGRQPNEVLKSDA